VREIDEDQIFQTIQNCVGIERITIMKQNQMEKSNMNKIHLLVFLMPSGSLHIYKLNFSLNSKEEKDKIIFLKTISEFGNYYTFYILGDIKAKDIGIKAISRVIH